MYTLIETAKLNVIDPEAWLRNVIAHLASYPMRKIHSVTAHRSSVSRNGFSGNVN